jgi:hypothetical protein
MYWLLSRKQCSNIVAGVPALPVFSHHVLASSAKKFTFFLFFRKDRRV